jgi:DRG Family Regulatory Proteins, Tma46
VRKEQEALEKANEISLEDFLEVERHKLGKDLTPVTAETFAQWKKNRIDKKDAEEQLAKNKKEAQAKMNKMTGLSGREMFTLNPDMFEEDDGEDDGEVSRAMRVFSDPYQLLTASLTQTSMTCEITSKIGSRMPKLAMKERRASAKMRMTKWIQTSKIGRKAALRSMAR